MASTSPAAGTTPPVLPGRTLMAWLRWPLRLLGALAVFKGLQLLQLVLGHSLNEYNVQILTVAAIWVIMAVSLNLINGITGQFSLGHAGFMAVGAYAAASFSLYARPRLMFSDEVCFALAIMAGATAAGVAGLLVGLPSLRLRGDYLAIVTLGFGQIIVTVIRNIPALGESTGLSGVPTLTTFALCWTLAIGCIISVRNLADSSIGRSMRAVREDEIAAAAVGIDTTRIKVLAFVFSSMWAGVAGALQAHLLSTVHPDSFGFMESVKAVVTVVLGGLGSITGSAVAAVLLSVLEEKLREVAWAFAVGVVLCVLAAVLTYPRHRAAIATSKMALVRWLWWPACSLTAICAAFLYERPWLQSNKDALRYVIYALILIVLMLLRPQGLFGRSELCLRWPAGKRRS